MPLEFYLHILIIEALSYFKMDVKIAFLIVYLKKEAYIEQPYGFIIINFLVMFLDLTRHCTILRRHPVLGMSLVHIL